MKWTPKKLKPRCFSDVRQHFPTQTGCSRFSLESTLILTVSSLHLSLSISDSPHLAPVRSPLSTPIVHHYLTLSLLPLNLPVTHKSLPPCNSSIRIALRTRIRPIFCAQRLLLLVFRPHRMHSVHTMRPIATDGVAWSVCLSVGHVREPYKNGWTDRDADWRVDLGGPKKPCIR